jgi:hypothetical protein
MITVSDEQLKEIVRISKLGLLDSDECKEAIAMMATELLTLREQNRWRKYPDEEPDPWKEVIVKLRDGRHVLTKKVNYNSWWCCIPEEIIEWQPLPSAPDAKGGE